MQNVIQWASELNEFSVYDTFNTQIGAVIAWEILLKRPDKKRVWNRTFYSGRVGTMGMKTSHYYSQELDWWHF